MPKTHHSSVGQPAMGISQLSLVLMGGTELPLCPLYSALCSKQSNVEIVQNGCHLVLIQNADILTYRHTHRVGKADPMSCSYSCFSPPSPCSCYACLFPSQRLSLGVTLQELSILVLGTVFLSGTRGLPVMLGWLANEPL